MQHELSLVLKQLVLSAIIVACAAVMVTAAEAPKFSLKSLNGKAVDVGALIGKKIVVLNFWASWCSACEEEIPALNVLKESPGADKAMFYGINVGEHDAQIRYFVKKNKYPYMVLKDPERRASRQFELTSVPATIIIGKDGKVIFKGALPPQKYKFK